MTIDGDLLYDVLRTHFKNSHFIEDDEKRRKIIEIYSELSRMSNKGINIKSLKFNVTNFNQL